MSNKYINQDYLDEYKHADNLTDTCKLCNKKVKCITHHLSSCHKDEYKEYQANKKIVEYDFNDPSECKFCQVKCQNVKVLKNHIKTVHLRKTTKCEICN